MACSDASIVGNAGKGHSQKKKGEDASASKPEVDAEDGLEESPEPSQPNATKGATPPAEDPKESPPEETPPVELPAAVRKCVGQDFFYEQHAQAPNLCADNEYSFARINNISGV